MMRSRAGVSLVSVGKDSHVLQIQEVGSGRSNGPVGSMPWRSCQSPGLHAEAPGGQASTPPGRAPQGNALRSLTTTPLAATLPPPAMQGLLDKAPAPSNWEPMPGKKGVRRYISPELRRLAKRLEEAQEQREAAGTGILQVC